MSRWGERDERQQKEGGANDALSRGGGTTRQRTTERGPTRSDFGANRREPVLLRDRTVHVRPSEAATLSALGRFRLIDADDLSRGIYGGKRLAEADFASLRRQKLLGSAVVRDAWGRSRRVLTLTRDGYSVARLRVNAGQQLYWGFAKPSETAHDSRYYRAFCHEERRLAAEGYQVKRVLLDYELKRQYFGRLNAPEHRGSYHDRQAESGQLTFIPIIDGHSVFPDFRIEYEDDRGEIGRVDVEVASNNYHDHHIATKASAGFQIYGSAEFARRLGIAEGSLGGGSYPEERSVVLLL